MSFIKDPNAVLDYQWDWSDWLAVGETIETSTMLVPAGLTMDSDDHGDTTATVWLSGGTAGSTYTVTNRITTNQDRTDDRTARFLIRER